MDPCVGGLLFENASAYTVTDSYIVNNRQIGIDVWNKTNADNGDATICECIFDTMYITGASISECAIKQHSSGGLRIQNNKILNHQYAYRGYFESLTIDTSDLLIQDNSIEGQSIACIHIDKTDHNFSNILITNNQMVTFGDGIKFNNYFARVTITGNIILLGSINKSCIWIGQGNNYIVSNNILDGQSLTGSYGVYNSTATNVFANNRNLYSGLTTPQAGTLV